MTNEKLIEEAAKAIQALDFPDHGIGWDESTEYYRESARAALAVFEKAHTPTDDEREALRVASPVTWGWDACIVCGSRDVTDRGMVVMVSKADGAYVGRVAWCDGSQECRDDLRQAGASMLTEDQAEAIDAALRHSPAPAEDEQEAFERFVNSFNGGEAGGIDLVRSILGDTGWAMRGGNDVRAVFDKAVAALAAHGFRHPEVPEPSAECPKCGVRVADQTPSTFYTHHDETCGGALEEPQGEPSDAPTVQLMARKGGKTQTLIEQMLNQANERGVRVEVVDQVIPRYAMLDVWMALYGHETSQAFDAFYEGAEYSEAWSTLLAAIRTRAGEPQGEPSDASVRAALSEWFQGIIAGGWTAEHEARMRAALRAASAATAHEVKNR